MNHRLAIALSLVAVTGGCARVASPLSDNLGGNSVGPDLAMPFAMPDLASDGTGGGDPPDMAMPGTTVHDLAMPSAPPDLAVARDLAMPSAPPDLATPANCHLVINEIMTGTTQTLTEEWVEIFNPCSAAVTVDGWKLGYRAATNTDGASAADSSTLYSFAGSIPAGAYRLLGGSGYAGTKDGALGSGIAASGAVALRNGAGTIVDAVAWGTVTTGNAFIETSAAPAPPTAASPGDSIERLPNGTDSDNNHADFASASTPTPGAANH